MKRKDADEEQYRRQLNEWVAALAVADNEAIADDAAAGYTAADLDLFTEGNLSKRADILDLQLSFLKRGFADLTELIDEYLLAQPLVAYAAGPPDAAAFLRWLSESYELTPEQEDHVACRLARFDVEDAARDDRRAHVRFQERLSVAPRLVNDLERSDRLRVHLNPARGWAKLNTYELIDEQSQLPADVVFYAVGTEIRSAVLDEPVPALLEALADGPLTLDAWAERAGLGGREELPALVRRLADLGLVAFS